MSENGARFLDVSHRTTPALMPASARDMAESSFDVGPTSDFLAMLAHELRNALSPMANVIQLLRMAGATNVDPSRAHELLERQVALMSHLVNDMQEISTVSSTHMPVRLRQLDLRQVVARSVEAVTSAFAHRQHHVAVAIPDEPIWVEADPVRMEQVVVNLVNNAAKYTQDGGSISVSARAARGRAELRVSDNGIGIPTDMLKHVFALFARTETARRHSRTGLGIGLNVVQRIVASHGGSVVALSAGIGKGSEFVVTLPLIPHAA